MEWRDDFTLDETDRFWKEVAWENAEEAAGTVFDMRRESAKRLIELIQDSSKRLGFGVVGSPSIAIYADELARIARVPYPKHDCEPPAEDPAE